MDHRDDSLPLGPSTDHRAEPPTEPPVARKQPEPVAAITSDEPITAFDSNMGHAIQLELPQTRERVDTPSTDSLLIELSKIAAERSAAQVSAHRWPPARPRSWPKSWPWLQTRAQVEAGPWSPPWSTDAQPREEDADQETNEEKLSTEIPTLTTQLDDQPARPGWTLTLGPRSALAAAAVLVMAIAVTADSMWMSSSLDARITKLSAALKAQQQRPQPDPVLMQATTNSADVDALRDEVALLQQQINDLTAGLDETITAAVQPPEDQQQLTQRIDELEQIAAQWRQQQEQTRQRTAALAKQVEDLKPIATTPASSHKKAATSSTPPSVAKATPKAPRSSKGPWVVNLLSVSSRPEAERERNRLADMGIKAEIGSADVKGQTWYRIRVAGFASASKAQDFGDRIAVQTGLKGAWAGKK